MKFLTNTFYFNDEYREGNKYYFTRADSPEVLAKIRKTKDESWYYWDRDIVYTVNRDFYRNPFEFSEVNWKEAIVLMGCSCTMGAGLTDDDTIRSHLSKYTDRPIVNMGSAGTSMAWSFHNACILGTYYPEPWAIVNLWTGINRIVEYNSEDGGLKNLGPWHVARPGDLLDMYTKSPENPKQWAKFYSMASRLIWKNSNYFECTYFEDTAQVLSCKELNVVDRARDISHPGRETAQLTARVIAEALKLV